jgi:hypothetical protein
VLYVILETWPCFHTYEASETWETTHICKTLVQYVNFMKRLSDIFYGELLCSCYKQEYSCCWFCYWVIVGGFANVSEVHAISIFRVEVSRAGKCLCIYSFWSNRTIEKESCDSESWDGKIWSWGPEGPETRMTVLTRTSSSFTRPNPEVVVAGAWSKKISRVGREEVENGPYLRHSVLTYHTACVEAESSTSTIALWVVGGDEKGAQCLGA